MSIYEPNTQGRPEPTERDFIRSARRIALLWLIGTISGAIWGTRAYLLWLTWPRHVPLRKQSLGMDWWLHEAWIAWGVSAATIVALCVHLVLARRVGRRDQAAYKRLRAEVLADVERGE